MLMNFFPRETEAEAWVGNLRKETVAWGKGGGPRPQVVAV